MPNRDIFETKKLNFGFKLPSPLSKILFVSQSKMLFYKAER